MREILGKAKTVREILKGVKYTIDYYQREYKWLGKQARELVSDLSQKFLEEYDPNHERAKVADYPHYFLGSIIISKKDSANYIVDGQQRLTTLSLLIVLLRRLQIDRADAVNVDELIVSEKYGEKSFNLDVAERRPVMEALFEGQPFDPNGRPDSAVNIYYRYQDLDEELPGEIREAALPYFVDWLLENVHLVEITAYSDDDAYTIFETMNDRGLSLSPTEMLKGYLLSNIDQDDKREIASDRWRSRIHELNETGKEVESDFFKAWFRSQYATKIRERRKGARAEDFDRIGTEFHRWLRESSKGIGIETSDDFFRFIDRDFDFYSRQYLRLVNATRTPVPGLEYVLYNAHHGFTLQHMVLLAPILPSDDEGEITLKTRLVAKFLDILLTWRIWNFRSIAYSTMQYAMFITMRDIRGLPSDELGRKLHQWLSEEKETFDTNDRLRVHQQNRYALHRLLARITDFIETGSGQPSRYTEYVADGPSRYEVEHIWADHPDRHTDEFSHPADFAEHRNRIGGLLLLPKSFNASYGDLPFEEKLPHYFSQNLLARSLNEQCYQHNPGFLSFVEQTSLPFRPYTEFKKASIEERGALYRQIAKRIWNPDDLLREIGE
ncbi:MAG: DUF262 domain-containing protein [Alkalispirochaeta sp.]